MDPKKAKSAKQKPEPTVSDEVKKQIEKAIQEAKEHLQKIEDYIVRISARLCLHTPMF